ncbi:hypothetical protein KAM360_24880 [Aeromonas caviae]|nr:hypothetical protein KAM360_24880 [Aeromonas caviae]
MMNPVPWLQMTNMISYQGLVRTFPKTVSLDGWKEDSSKKGTFVSDSDKDGKCAVTYENKLTAVGQPTIEIKDGCK